MTSVLGSDRVQTVLARIRAEGLDEDEAYRRRVREREAELGTKLYGRERAELGVAAPLAVKPEVGQLLYVLALAARPRLIVEFGTSLGYSTIHLASALRDLGRGALITTELLREKAAAASGNLAAAGLGDLVEIRAGDALESLSELEADIDLLFLDGSNDLYLPVLELLEPRLASGVLIVADMSPGDPHHQRYREHVASRYLTKELPLDAGVVVSSKRI